jgi:hypothetical protein
MFLPLLATFWLTGGTGTITDFGQNTRELVYPLAG